MPLPTWAEKLIALYQSHSANQFLLYGNVNDRFLLRTGDATTLGSLSELLGRVIMPRFDVVLSYDLGNGIRVEKGGEIVSAWPGFKEHPDLPRAPRAAASGKTGKSCLGSNASAIEASSTISATRRVLSHASGSSWNRRRISSALLR